MNLCRMVITATITITTIISCSSNGVIGYITTEITAPDNFSTDIDDVLRVRSCWSVIVGRMLLVGINDRIVDS